MAGMAVESNPYSLESPRCRKSDVIRRVFVSRMIGRLCHPLSGSPETVPRQNACIFIGSTCMLIKCTNANNHDIGVRDGGSFHERRLAEFCRRCAAGIDSRGRGRRLE